MAKQKFILLHAVRDGSMHSVRVKNIVRICPSESNGKSAVTLKCKTTLYSIETVAEIHEQIELLNKKK